MNHFKASQVPDYSNKRERSDEHHRQPKGFSGRVEASIALSVQTRFEVYQSPACTCCRGPSP